MSRADDTSLAIYSALLKPETAAFSSYPIVAAAYAVTRTFPMDSRSLTA